MWHKIQKKFTTATGLSLSGSIFVIFLFTSYIYKNSALLIFGLIFLLIYLLLLCSVLGPTKYKTRDINYYQNKLFSKADRFITPYFLILIVTLVIFIFIIFAVKFNLKLEFGSIGTWASAIASSSAVILSLYKTFHVDYPKLIIKTKDVSKKNSNYVELDIDIQNIDKRVIVLKCFLTKGVYYSLPTNGDWSNNSFSTTNPKKIDINNLTVDKKLRKQIMQPILKLDSFTDPNARNKNGTLHLFLDKDTKSFTVALSDIHNNKEVYIKRMKICKWKAVI